MLLIIKSHYKYIIINAIYTNVNIIRVALAFSARSQPEVDWWPCSSLASNLAIIWSILMKNIPMCKEKRRKSPLPHRVVPNDAI